MDRITSALLFLILLSLTTVAAGVAVITAVSVKDYVDRSCY